jgi:hypothetical protein
MYDAEGTWVMMIVIVAGVAAIALLIAYSKSVFSRFQSRRLALGCPATDESVDVVVEKDMVTGSRRVVSCSRLDDPNHITCNQACIHPRRAARPQA